MIFRRLILALSAAAVLATAAGVCVVALAFALFAMVEPYVGRAGAGAVVAGSAALLAAIGGLALAGAARVRRAKPVAAATGSILDRLLGFVREKPVTAVSAAAAAGLLAIINPRYLGSAVRAFVEGRPPPRRWN